mgnify:CR=1 FL=1
MEARYVEMKDQLNRAEQKLAREEQKCESLTNRLQELNSVSLTSKSSIKTKTEQIDILQVSTELCVLFLFNKTLSHPMFTNQSSRVYIY